MSCAIKSLNSVFFPAAAFLCVFVVVLMSARGDVGEDLNKVGTQIEGVGGKIKDAVSKEIGALWCPIPVTGTKCPSSTAFYFYRCCGPLNNECCLNLQTWFVVACIGVGVVIVAGLLLSLIRCICCRRSR